MLNGQLLLKGLLFLFALSCLSANDHWEIKGTDIYTSLPMKNVQIAPNGHIFLCGDVSQQILHFDDQGNLVGRIGEAGQGPGQFGFVASFHFSHEDGLVYAVNLPRSSLISVFKSNGEYLKDIRFPGQNSELPVKAHNGWFYFNSSTNFQPNKTFKIIFADQIFASQRTVFEFPNPFRQKTMTSGGNGGIRVTLPTKRLSWAVRRDGSRLYLYTTGDFAVQIIDFTQKQHLGEYRREVPRIPVDEALRQEIEQKLQNKLSTEAQSLISTNFKDADFYPDIKQLVMGPENHLLIYYSVHFVQEDLPPIILGPDDKETTLPYTPQALKRLVEVVGDAAYVLTVRDGESGLAKIPKSQVNQFVEENPFTD